MNPIKLVRSIISGFSNKPEAWEWCIEGFEAQDRIHIPSKNAIVFTGSSSITFWDTLEGDMAPLPVINRGFGGSKINDVAFFANRIVTPYHPRAVVLFAGTNDIAWPHPKTAREVFEGYCGFVDSIHSALTDVPVYYISITPTPSRWKLWSIADDANHLIEAYTRRSQYLQFIDLTDHILTSEGLPDRSLYRMDRLHPNKKCYALWTSIIKPILVADLG